MYTWNYFKSQTGFKYHVLVKFLQYNTNSSCSDQKYKKKKNQVIHANSIKKKVNSIINFYFNKCVDYDKQLIYIYILPPIWLPHYWNIGRCTEPPAKSLRILASSCRVDNQFFFPKNEAREGYRLIRRTKMVSNFFLLIDPFRFSFPISIPNRNVCYSRELGNKSSEKRTSTRDRPAHWFLIQTTR